MPPIGETLREARLRQQIDIAEVEQATKIRAKYLRALEGEEFDRLPGSTFVRTFLRTYAEYLGLDPQLLVEEYRARHESPGEEEIQRLAPPPPPRAGGREGRRRFPSAEGGPGRGALIAGTVLAVLALLIVIGLVSGGGGEPDGRPTAGERGREARGGERGDGRADGGGGGRQRPDDVTLRVAPASETYVCVVVEGESEPVINEVIQEPETFRGERLLVNLGNTLVELEANGEEVPIEEGPNPAGFEFTPGGHEELPEDERPCT